MPAGNNIKWERVFTPIASQHLLSMFLISMEVPGGGGGVSMCISGPTSQLSPLRSRRGQPQPYVPLYPDICLGFTGCRSDGWGTG